MRMILPHRDQKAVLTQKRAIGDTGEGGMRDSMRSRRLENHLAVTVSKT